jgi:MFS family permease
MRGTTRSASIATTTESAPAPATTWPIPGLIKRNTLYLAAAQACVGTGNQMMPTLGALMVVHLTGTEVLAGAATAILGGCRLLSAYPTGWITDTYGRRAGLFLGMLLCMLGSLLIGVAIMQHAAGWFFVGVTIFGVGVGAVQQLRLAAADMYPPRRRAEGLGYVLTGSLVGALGGPVLIASAQNLAPSTGLDVAALAWLLVPILLVPSIALVFLIRPDPKEIARHLDRYYPGLPPPRPQPRAARASGSLTSFLRYYPRLTAFVTTTAVYGNMTMMMAMNALALAHHGHDLPAISLSVALHIVGMFGFSLPLGRLADRLGRRPVLLAGIVTAAVGGALVSLGADYWVVTGGTFLVGLGWSCINVAGVALIADTTGPDERGRAVGTNDTINGAASISLPLLAGPLVALAGIGSLAWVSVGLMIVPLIMLLRLRETSPGRYAH